jgi:thiamine-phosphate pyrophosphorylase
MNGSSPVFPPLYPILDALENPRSMLTLADCLAGAGVRLLQIRAKKSSVREIFELARQMSTSLSPQGIRVIVNDRADVAAMSGSGGVHVGQEDLPVEMARQICHFGMWVGVSTHNLAQLRQAGASSADYIAVGPVFPTRTKENLSPVVGLDFLRAARAATKKPLVAIGGITVESAEQVFRAGADCVAVIRDLAASSDPAARAREYFELANRVLALRREV